MGIINESYKMEFTLIKQFFVCKTLPATFSIKANNIARKRNYLSVVSQ